MNPAVGFTLHSEPKFLGLLEGLALRHADVLEVAPETLWFPEDDGRFRPNSYWERILRLGRGARKRFVAHGVGWSPCGAEPVDAPRSRRWLEAIAATHAAFAFEWYTDHFGTTELAGESVILPVAVPLTEASLSRGRARLAALQRIVPDVGLENSVFYYQLGDPLDEALFLGSLLLPPRQHLLLDLHNVFTTAANCGFEPHRYLERLPLERVIEIHLSGGTDSDPAWLGGEVMRLDSHDRAVPEPVWRLLDDVLLLCRNLRCVTLERMEGTVEAADVAVLEAELLRVRRAVEGGT